MSVYQKLMQVQTQLKAPKNQYNSFGKYKYRSLEDILEAVKKIQSNIGFTVHFERSLEMAGDRYYIKSTAIFTDIESGNTVKNCAFAREPLTRKGMDESQITGSTTSYADKYAISGLFGIDDNKEVDAQNNKNEPNKKNETLSGYIKKAGVSAKDFVSYYMIQQSQAKELLANKQQLDKMIAEYKAAKAT